MYIFVWNAHIFKSNSALLLLHTQWEYSPLWSIYDTKLMEVIAIAYRYISSGPWKLDEGILHTETKMMQSSIFVASPQKPMY